MKVKLGISPIAWSNDDLPQLGGSTSLETCLIESRIAGFSGVESGGKFPLEDISLLTKTLNKHNLKLVSGWFSGRLLDLSLAEEKDRIEQQLQTFKKIGAPVLIYAETSGSVQTIQGTPVSHRPTLATSDIKDYGHQLSLLADHLQAHGVKMSYHHHMGTIIEKEHEVDLLMNHTRNSVGLLVDTGHMIFAGGDPFALSSRHAKRINHIHCKDIREDILKKVHEEDMSFLDAVLAGVFTVPGDGFIDFNYFTRLLQKINYNGWIIVEAEQDPEQANPLTYARIGYNELVNSLTKAGAQIIT